MEHLEPAIERYDKGVPNLQSYAHALKHFERVKPIRGSEERPTGQRNLKNRRMVRRPDGSISFSYFGNEISCWHPDGTVSVTALGQQRNGGYPQLVLPAGVYIDIGTRTGPIAYLSRGENNYRSYNGLGDVGENTRWSFWQERWNRKEAGESVAKRNDEMWVVRARKPVHIHRDAETGAWRPVHAASLEPFEWSALDKAKARKVAAVAGIPSFVAAMDAIVALGGEIPPFEGTQIHRWNPSAENYDDALALIEAGNFIGAMAMLRRDAPWKWDKDLGRQVQGVERIVSTELERIRTQLYLREGALEQHSRQTLTLAEYIACEGALKRFK